MEKVTDTVNLKLKINITMLALCSGRAFVRVNQFWRTKCTFIEKFPSQILYIKNNIILCLFYLCKSLLIHHLNSFYKLDEIYQINI